MPTQTDNVRPRILVMGPAGSGKTTVGKALALHLGVPFADADAFHTPLAVEKMASGVALTDEDRTPWLAALAVYLEESRDGLVLACSALKARYRTVLRVGAPFATHLAYLAVPADVLRQRLAERSGHFAGPALLDSQLSALEVPPATETYDGTSPPAALIAEMCRRMNLAQPAESP